MLRRCTRFGLFALTIALLSAGIIGVAWGASPPVTQGVTKDSIKIGIFAPFTGPAASYGKNAHLVEAIYRDLNDKGGINGRKIEMVIDDSVANPANGRLLVKKQVESDKVFMIHAEIASNVVIAARPTIEETGVPFLAMAPASSRVTDPPIRNLFSWNAGTNEQSKVIAEFVKSIKPKSIVVIAQRDEWGLSWYEPFMAALKGTEIAVRADEKIENPIGDATPQVRVVLREKPDAIVLFTYPQPTSVFLRDAYAQGVRVPMVSSAGAVPDDELERVGQREPVQPFIAVHYAKYSIDHPDYDVYKKLLAKYYPKDVFDSSVMWGITGALLNIEVLKRMGDNLTWENYIKTMEGVRNFVSTTNAGPVNFKAFDPKDPMCRRGITKVAFSALNPDLSKPALPTVVFEDYPGYQAYLKK